MKRALRGRLMSKINSNNLSALESINVHHVMMWIALVAAIQVVDLGLVRNLTNFKVNVGCTIIPMRIALNICTR
jgi:hypothetical protein